MAVEMATVIIGKEKTVSVHTAECQSIIDNCKSAAVPSHTYTHARQTHLYNMPRASIGCDASERHIGQGGRKAAVEIVEKNG